MSPRPVQHRQPLLSSLAGGSPKAGETDLTPSERLFVQVGPRVRIRLPPAASLRTLGPAWNPRPLIPRRTPRSPMLRIFERLNKGARNDAPPKRTQRRRSRNPRNDQGPAQHAPAPTR